MTFHRIISTLLFPLLLSPLMAFGKTTKTNGAVANPGNVLRATLGNGMRVIIIRDTLAPVVATMMNYEVGSDQSPPGFPGTAHAQEHMMFRGSKTLSADQYAEITAVTGGGFDADTQNTVTQYYYIMPSQDLDIALHLEAARAEGLSDSPDEWGQEKGAIEQEVTQDYSNAEFRLYVQMQEHLLHGTPDGIDGLGTVPTFDKTTAAMLKNFYTTYYHPNNAIFIIAGDVDPAKILAEVKKLFGAIPPAKIPPTNYGKNPPQARTTYRTESDLPYTAVLTGYLYPSYHDRDWAAAQILSDVLSSQRGPLYDLVAQGKALAASFFPNFLPNHGTAYAEIDVPVGTDPKIALKTLEQGINAYKKSGVPSDLVEAAKNREIASAEFNRNSIFGLAMAWSQAVAVEGRPSPEDDVRAIRQVTVAEVNAVLRKYLVNENAAVGYAIPKPGGPVSAGTGKHAENNTVIPKGPVTLPTWASRLIGHVVAPEQTLHPTVTRLPNGITLIVQPEHETRTVILRGSIDNRPDMETPEGKMGVASLTERLLPFGTARYSRLQYQAELDKISATVTTGTDFSLDVLSRSFDRGVALLAEDELHPAFSPDAFAIVKNEELGEVKGVEKSPDHLAAVAMSRALYPPGDPALRFASSKSVAALSLEDVRGYYKQVYRPDMTYIAVVGDVTPEKARQVVMRYFGGWKAEGPKPTVDPTPVADNKTAYQIVPDTGRIQDAVTLAQTLPITAKDKDFPSLSVANAILGKGFYASLLYHDLREVKGYVYYVDSDLSIGKTRSTFSITYGSMPDKTQPAKDLVLSDLKNLQNNPVSSTRLQYAKALLVGEVPLHEQSYHGVASQMINYAMLDLPLDENIREAKAEIGITPEAIEAAMKKWIRPDDLVEIVEGPAPK